MGDEGDLDEGWDDIIVGGDSGAGKVEYPDDIDDEDGHPPTDEELRELGIDPDENRARKENPRSLPDVLKGTSIEERLDFLRNESIAPDAEPADPSDLNGGADGNRTLDELFGSDEGDN